MRFDLAHRHERRHAAAIHERHEECLGAMAVRSSYGSVSLPDRTRRPLDASALGARSLADVRAVHAAHRACSSLLCQCGSSPQPRLVGGTILRIHLRKRGPPGPAFGDDYDIRTARQFGLEWKSVVEGKSGFVRL